jgi:hypothetical protein
MLLLAWIISVLSGFLAWLLLLLLMACALFFALSTLLSALIML